MVCYLSVLLSLSIAAILPSSTICAYCYCLFFTLHTHHPFFNLYPHLLFFTLHTHHPTFIFYPHLLLSSTVGLAGLSISFALAVTQALNWTVRMASDMEGQMVSVGKQAREEGRIPMMMMMMMMMIEDVSVRHIAVISIHC